jgi:Protein of unknown function (DUF3712)
MVNDANIPISSIRIAHPTTDNARLSLQASIKLPTPLSVHLDPVPLSLFMNDGTANIVPYTSIVIPKSDLRGNTTLAFADQLVQILDKNIFAEFVNRVLFSKTFMLSVKGSTNAYVGKLKAHINLEKNIPLTGKNPPLIVIECCERKLIKVHRAQQSDGI